MKTPDPSLYPEVQLPKQGDCLGRRVRVLLRGQLGPEYEGTIIRDDMEQNHMTAILLDNGILVLGWECQYCLK